MRFLELTHTEAATPLGLYYIAQAQTTKGDRVHTRQRTPPKPPLVAPRRVKGHFLARRARIQKRFARPRLPLSKCGRLFPSLDNWFPFLLEVEP